MADDEARRQLDGFIDKYTPEVAALARALLEKMKRRLPGAHILVYDNYNALAIGVAPNDKVGDAIFSIAAYPRWASLFFLQGAGLPDPDGLLQGSGSRVRHIRMPTAEAFDDPRVEALIVEALARADVPIDPTGEQRLIIKSVSPKQRPRRP